MKIKKILVASFILVIAGAIGAFAKPKAPTEYNSFDGFAPGARALALGYAFCAIADEPAAIYFNPAGLQAVDGNLLGITYEVVRQSELTTEQIFNFEKLKNKNLIFLGINSEHGAFSFRPITNDVQKVTNGADWSETETKINAFTFTASAEHEKKLYSGLNLTYLNGTIARSEVTANVPSTNISEGHGVSFDFAFLYKASEEMNLAVNFKNLAGFLWWDDYEKDMLPFTLRAGFSLTTLGYSVFSCDWEKRYYRKENGAEEFSHFGLEQKLGSVMSVQFGIFGQNLNTNDKKHMTSGLTYRNNKYMLSLAGEKYQVNAVDVYRYLFSLNIPI